ncbi:MULTISPECIES: hypothetical protein [Bacillaceae]|uniref:hypothetical protein n=1 Tax=Bacillus timonensis TaxID=1033734 RepID=UPI0002888DD5|nr:hypothetical protein [Bacillus timonensis]
MTHRGAGMSFIAIAAFLISTRYIVAAIFGSNMESWNKVMFKSALEGTGYVLLILSIISFVIGAVYLVNAEVRK